MESGFRLIEQRISAAQYCLDEPGRAVINSTTSDIVCVCFDGKLVEIHDRKEATPLLSDARNMITSEETFSLVVARREAQHTTEDMPTDFVHAADEASASGISYSRTRRLSVSPVHTTPLERTSIERHLVPGSLKKEEVIYVLKKYVFYHLKPTGWNDAFFAAASLWQIDIETLRDAMKPKEISNPRIFCDTAFKSIENKLARHDAGCEYGHLITRPDIKAPGDSRPAYLKALVDIFGSAVDKDMTLAVERHHAFTTAIDDTDTPAAEVTVTPMQPEGTMRRRILLDMLDHNATSPAVLKADNCRRVAHWISEGYLRVLSQKEIINIIESETVIEVAVQQKTFRSSDTETCSKKFVSEKKPLCDLSEAEFKAAGNKIKILEQPHCSFTLEALADIDNEHANRDRHSIPLGCEGFIVVFTDKKNSEGKKDRPQNCYYTAHSMERYIRSKSDILFEPNTNERIASIHDRPQLPKSSITTVRADKDLPGLPGQGQIKIIYKIPAGRQPAGYPEPGRSYCAACFYTYLPANTKGNMICSSMMRAFQLGYTFSFGLDGKVRLSETIEHKACPVLHNTHYHCHYRGHYQNDPDYARDYLAIVEGQLDMLLNGNGASGNA